MNEHARLPRSLFDDVVASRPDEERWDLIDERIVMQATPNVEDRIVARLLNDALQTADLERSDRERRTRIQITRDGCAR